MSWMALIFIGLKRPLALIDMIHKGGATGEELEEGKAWTE